ncbi:POK9 protein, partial [Hirundo rustica]|nr:POK9 protein [Hirundo rustica]
RGSLEIDLAAAVDVTLIDSRVQRFPPGVTGPIYDKNSALGALLVGRSSTGLSGLIVLPGVLDADYTGEIQVVAYAFHPSMTIKKGTRIAQLVLYTKEAVKSDIFQSAPQRGSQGFGSTGEALVNLVQQMKNRPLITLNLSWGTWEHTLSEVMTDTGADVTILD